MSLDFSLHFFNLPELRWNKHSELFVHISYMKQAIPSMKTISSVDQNGLWMTRQYAKHTLRLCIITWPNLSCKFTCKKITVIILLQFKYNEKNQHWVGSWMIKEKTKWIDFLLVHNLWIKLFWNLFQPS